MYKIHSTFEIPEQPAKAPRFCLEFGSRQTPYVLLRARLVYKKGPSLWVLHGLQEASAQADRARTSSILYLELIFTILSKFCPVSEGQRKTLRNESKLAIRKASRQSHKGPSSPTVKPGDIHIQHLVSLESTKDLTSSTFDFSEENFEYAFSLSTLSLSQQEKRASRNFSENKHILLTSQ